MVDVSVVSAQSVVSAGLKAIFRESAVVRVVRSVETLRQLPVPVPGETAGVVLVDADSALDLVELRGLCKRERRRVCLFARSISPEFLFQVREAGASGIISTNRSAAEITAAVCAVSEGQLAFDPLFTGTNPLNCAVHLTPREGHLVELLTQGLKNKEIAYHLGITEGTVKVYLSKLFQKVGAKDRFDLALSGLKNLGLASLEAGADPSESAGSNPNTLRTLVTRRAAVRERRLENRAIAV